MVISKRINKSGLPYLSFIVNKRLYFQGSGFDFYRKAIVPLSASYDYIEYLGREPSVKPVIENGKVVKLGCNSYFGSYVCDCEGTRKSKLSRCTNTKCEKCFHKAIVRQCKRIKKRYNDVENLEGKSLGFQHFTFNVREIPKKELESKKFKKPYSLKFDTLKDFKFSKGMLVRLLKSYGVSGILVPHPWRKDKEVSSIERKPYVKKGFHFHVLGRFDNLPNGKDFYEKYGFTYKNISYDQYVGGKLPSPYIQHDIHFNNIVRYLLSHAGHYGAHRSSYSYIGGFSPYHYKKLNESRKMVDVKCCIRDCNDVDIGCGSPLYKVNQEFYNDKTYAKEGPNFDVELNAMGAFKDLYLYKREGLSFDYEKTLRKLEHNYDYIYRKDYVLSQNNPVVMCCETCDNRNVKEKCNICKNFNLYYNMLLGGSNG